MSTYVYKSHQISIDVFNDKHLTSKEEAINILRTAKVKLGEYSNLNELPKPPIRDWYWYLDVDEF